MLSFSVIFVQNSKEEGSQGWAVQRAEPDGSKMRVTKLFATEQEAINEAARLNRESARRHMG
jgi:hypothetical protein